MNSTYQSGYMGLRLVLMATMLTIAGCGGGGGRVATQTPRRWCELSGQLDQAAAGTGAGPETGALDGPAESIAKMLAQIAPTLTELKASSPKKIRGDVTTSVDALNKARNGDLTAVRAAKFADARGNIAAFRASACPAGGSGGDG